MVTARGIVAAGQLPSQVWPGLQVHVGHALAAQLELWASPTAGHLLPQASKQLEN